MKLYEIARQYEEVFAKAYNEDTGEINETAMQELNAIEGDAKEKCVAVVKWMKHLESEYDAINKEKRLMAAREERYKKQVEWYKKTYLLQNMQRCHITEISCPEFMIQLRTNPHSVDIYDESSIPEQYHKVTISYDKAGMLQAMKAGNAIAGARLKQDQSVRIS